MGWAVEKFFLKPNYNKGFSSPFHFADDTGLLNIQYSMHAINKTLNKDLRELSFWLNDNKIALNVEKTEIILFKTRNKNYDADLKIKLCRKRIHSSQYVKYLGAFIDENLNWKKHINNISTKLIKGNAMLPKLRHFVNKRHSAFSVLWYFSLTSSLSVPGLGPG